MSKIFRFIFGPTLRERREAAAERWFRQGDLAEAQGLPIAAARRWLRGANTLRGDYDSAL